MRRAWIGAAVISLALAGAAPARAEGAADVAVARDLFKEASTLAQRGEWEAARARYAQSLALKRAAITLYSIAVAERSSGHWVDALEHFRSFLAEPSSAGTRAYEAPAREAVADLERRVARLRIVVAPAGVEPVVTIDGAAVPLAALERSRLVDPGGHVVAARAKGYQPVEESVTLAEGGAAEVRLVLAPAKTNAADAPLPALPLAGAPARPTSPRAPPSRALPIVVVVSGAALFAAGFAVGLVGYAQAKDAPTRDGADASAAKTKALVGDVLAGTGVAAVGVGVVLWLTAGAAPRSSAARPTPYASADTAGLRVAF